MSIAKYGKFIWIFQKFFVEVENMTVRIALAKNGNKTKDIACEAKALAIRGNQALARKFGCAIQGCLHRKWRVFGRGDNFCFSIH